MDLPTYLTNFKLAGVIVLGAINSKQQCVKCGKKFSAAAYDNEGFICANGCGTRPTRYYLVLKGFGIMNPMYTDPQTNDVFKTHSHAFSVLNAINREYLDAAKNKARFKIENWVPTELQARQVKSVCEQRLETLRAEVAQKAKSNTRLNNVTKAFRFIVDYFGDRDIRKIDETEIRAFYLKLLQTPVTPRGKQEATGETLGSKYIKDILNELRSLFLSYRPNDIPKFPEVRIIPKIEKQVLGLTREMAALDKVPGRHGYRIAILILLRTGARINEVVALKKHNLIDGHVVVDKAFSEGDLKFARKSGEQVFYRVTPELWDMLQTHSEGLRDDDFLFAIDGHPISTGRLYKVWKKACVDAGVKHISLQQASRHSTATRIFEQKQKEALRDIQEQLGHDNLTTGKKHYVLNPDISSN